LIDLLKVASINGVTVTVYCIQYA